jgi:hypothetical protein
MRALFRTWVSGHWRRLWRCGCALAIMGLAGCGERGGAAPSGSEASSGSPGAVPPGSAVVVTATAVVQVATPAPSAPWPEPRLGRAVEVGADGEPVSPKR